MDSKIVGCQNIEDFNRFLSEIQKITMEHSVILRYSSGVWPDIKLRIEDITKGEIVADNISLAETESLMTLVLLGIFMDDDKVRSFYEILRKYFAKWNLPVLPFFTILDIQQLDIQLTVFIALDLEKHKNESVDEWKKFASQNKTIQHRLRSDINRSGVFTNHSVAIDVYVQLLYMLAINPTMVIQAVDNVDSSEILITRTQD